VIKAVMPKAIPSIEVREMKEMKVIAALGAGVAQADEQFQGTKHRRSQ
jgi:hypothetical protein